MLEDASEHDYNAYYTSTGGTYCISSGGPEIMKKDSVKRARVKCDIK